MSFMRKRDERYVGRGGGGGQEGNWNLRSWEGVSKDARNEF